MSKLDEKFIVNLQGSEFVLYNGLVDLAHKEGLISIEVELLQSPTTDNGMVAIAKATAKTKDKVFTDIGDAGPASVSKMLVPHIIRMASTRAKARALRDLTNIGMTAVEEMIEEDSLSKSDYKKEFTKKSTKKETTNELKCSKCSIEINEAVQTFSTNKFGKPLCIACQKKQK